MNDEMTNGNKPNEVSKAMKEIDMIEITIGNIKNELLPVLFSSPVETKKEADVVGSPINKRLVIIKRALKTLLGRIDL